MLIGILCEASWLSQLPRKILALKLRDPRSWCQVVSEVKKSDEDGQHSLTMARATCKSWAWLELLRLGACAEFAMRTAASVLSCSFG